MDTVGTRIRTAREKADITQERLAAAAGVTSMTISNIERGISEPSRKTLRAIARVLGLDADELILAPFERIQPRSAKTAKSKPPDNGNAAA